MTYEWFQQPSADFCRLWGKPANYVFRLAKLWDATFSCHYFSVRAQLKQIAERNIAEANDIIFVPYQQYSNIPDSKSFYIFMDDDDWLAPEISDFLQQYDTDEHAALLWRSMNVGGSQQEHPVFIWGLNGRCMTNNYAVSGVWLNHLQRIHAVTQHAVAEKTLATMENIRQLDAVLTASNKSPCSSVALDRGLQGNFTSTNLSCLVDDYLTKMATLTPAHLWMGQWAEPWIAEVVQLFQTVSASRIR